MLHRHSMHVSNMAHVFTCHVATKFGQKNSKIGKKQQTRNKELR